MDVKDGRLQKRKTDDDDDDDSDDEDNDDNDDDDNYDDDIELIPRTSRVIGWSVRGGTIIQGNNT